MSPSAKRVFTRNKRSIDVIILDGNLEELQSDPIGKIQRISIIGRVRKVHHFRQSFKV